VYQDDECNLTNVATIGTEDLHETQPSLSIDPVTGDPIVAWNRPDGVVCSYDLYHLGSPGLWKSPFYLIDANTWTPDPEDDFRDPIIKIGQSPDPGKRRVHILTRNYRMPITFEGYDMGLLMYADFDVNDFNNQSELNWTYSFIMDLLNFDHTSLNFTFDVSDDLVIIIGYDDNHNIYSYINENYGEGDFEFYNQEFKFPVSNPLNQDGTARFTDDQGNPYELFLGPHFSSNSNAIITADNEKILYPICFNLAAEPDIVQVDECLLYPKVVTFNLSTEDFSFIDLHLKGADPDDNIPTLPWDVNEDGEVDSYDMNGRVDWIPSWPIYYYDNTLPYPLTMNNMRITQNEDNNVIAIFWNDSSKAYFANYSGVPTWSCVPDIVATFSNDEGETWLDEQYLNSIATPELEDMIPEFFYPADKLVDIGYGEYTLSAMFYNDFDYAPLGLNPQIPGGELNISTFHIIHEETNNSINITQPIENEIWEIGEEVSINWLIEGSAMPIKIDLVNGFTDFLYCICEEPIGGSCIWTVPDSVQSGAYNRIRIMSLSPPCYFYSHFFFIYEPQGADEIVSLSNELFQNIPNPFNPSTTISFTLSIEQDKLYELSVYNLKGQKVKTYSNPELVEGFYSSNSCSIVWDGIDDSGKPVSSGVYLYKLKVGEFEESKKMLLLR
jgi:hypothetical protein